MRPGSDPEPVLGSTMADQWSHMQHSEAKAGERCRHVEGATRSVVREEAASAAGACSM
jgi:hypothetical protein